MELQVIQNKIYEVRGQKVMLDFDLAELYGSETKRLKEAVELSPDGSPQGKDYLGPDTESQCRVPVP